ncbi:MAG: 16S rRNA (cytosine(1402)-N(4))-methyltransferase RsmH [Gammaproteobacteria bacterium]
MSVDLNHEPVLRKEALDGLAVREGGQYLDGTYGRGGHASAILRGLGPEGRLLVIDRDPVAVAKARTQWGSDTRVRVMQGNFADMRALSEQAGLESSYNGILLDLGVSSPQLDQAERGFSFRADGPLDMRMDPSSGRPASAWVNSAPVEEIADVIKRYGEERFARRVAAAIVRAREASPFQTTTELADVVARAVPGREPGKNPATRTFQAIRIHINDELAAISRGLEQSVPLLTAGGRLCVISFHSLEDRIVKRFIRRESEEDEVWRGLPDMPDSARPALRRLGGAIRAGREELAKNPRARSAVLRTAEKLN